MDCLAYLTVVPVTFLHDISYSLRPVDSCVDFYLLYCNLYLET